MQKNELKILVIDDDMTFGKGTVELLKKAGFTALHVAKPDEAISQAKIQGFNGFIIDCLLPAQSGIEVAKLLNEQHGKEAPIVLISGIYKDKNFVKDALTKTGAIAFFEKPVKAEDLVETFESALKELIDEPTEPFTEILYKQSTTPGERLAAVTSTSSLHGFELPRAINYLLGPSIVGTLNLKDLADNSSSSVSFSNGKITAVKVKDPESYFGALLVEKNYLSSEELELTLANPSQKRVGERLVEANLISPHVISIINSEQMAIRLSRLVKETSYECTWTSDTAPESDAFVDQTILNTFCSDWIISKISLHWLKTFYLPLAENKITKTSAFNENHSVTMLPPLLHQKGFATKAIQGVTLQQLVNERPQEEEKVFGAIHQLVLAGLVAFDKAAKGTDLASQLNRFQKVFNDIKNKNHFEVLGITTKSKSSDIKKSYHELAKVFHPDKLPPGTPEELKILTRDIFAKMTVAYETLSNDTSRTNYLKELEQGRAEKILQSEALFEEGKAHLKAGQVLKAQEKFKVAMSLRPPSSELILHSLWARLMSLSQTKDQQKELMEIEAGLGRIPPEERHSAIYYFVKGLFQKYLGETELAKRNIQHALSLNQNFVEAQRELNLMKSAVQNKPVDIFRDDLSTVVTSLFKKKK